MNKQLLSEEIQKVLTDGSSADLFVMATVIRDGIPSIPVDSTISQIENRLLAVGTTLHLFKFARAISTANIEKIQEAFIRRVKEDSKLEDQPSVNNNNCILAYNFALEVSGADVVSLAEIPVLLENAQYSKKFLAILDIKENDSIAVLSSALKIRRPR
jgi:hypothetical protein